MEPYRIFVDVLVNDIIQSNGVTEDLTTALKMSLLQLPVMDVIIDGHKSPLMVAMSRTTNSLYECFLGKSRKILYPDFYDSKRI